MAKVCLYTVCTVEVQISYKPLDKGFLKCTRTRSLFGDGYKVKSVSKSILVMFSTKSSTWSREVCGLSPLSSSFPGSFGGFLRSVSVILWRTWDLETTLAAASVRKTSSLCILLICCNTVILQNPN